MARFTVTLSGDRIELVDHADAYQQEGPLTTFFAFAGGRDVIDSWSSRLASFRTSDVIAVRRSEVEAPTSLDTDGSVLDEAGSPPLLRSA